MRLDKLEMHRIKTDIKVAQKQQLLDMADCIQAELKRRE